MKYQYYKDKYKTITIKLDRVLDADIIEFFDENAKIGRGPKQIICELAAGRMMAAQMLALFCENEGGERS